MLGLGTRQATTETSKLSAAFDAGKHGRRLASIPTTVTAINQLIRSYGSTVLARSRYMSVNNPFTKKARRTFVDTIAGYGIRPSLVNSDQDQRRQVQDLWEDWTAEADADGITDFYGLQNQIAGEMFDAGECFAVFVPVKRSEQVTGIPFRIRLLPSEMLPHYLSEPVSSRAANGNSIDMGIEFDAEGNRVAYHFLRVHPGDHSQNILLLSSSETVRIPADRVMHVFEPVRVGAIRGVPHTLASMVTQAMTELYDDAELERKRVAALFAAFITKPVADSPDEQEAGLGPLGKPVSTGASSEQYGLEPGAMLHLDPGEDVSFAQPADVGQQYESFQYRNHIRTAAGMLIPYAYVTGDLSRANAGSFRVDLVNFKRYVTSMQWHYVIHQLCRPIWLRFMDEAAVSGELPWSVMEYGTRRRHLIRVRWLTPRWEWVDPLKDAQAEKLLVDNGFKARWDTVEEMGFDAQENDERIAAGQNSLEELGIELNAAPEDPSHDPSRGDVEENEDGDANPPEPKEGADSA